MNLQIGDRGGERQFALSGELTIASAAELKAALQDAWNSACPVSVQLDGVTEVDLSAMQLLFAAHADCTAIKRRLTMDAAPASLFRNALRAAGFLRFSGLCQCTNHRCLWRNEREYGQDHSDGG